LIVMELERVQRVRAAEGAKKEGKSVLYLPPNGRGK
jgi:hypothetical protein